MYVPIWMVLLVEAFVARIPLVLSIINGNATQPHANPHMVAMLYNDDFSQYSTLFCSGILVSAEAVVTTGHCCLRCIQHPGRCDLILGRWNMSDVTEPHSVVRQVKSFKVHPQYLLDRNIALDGCVMKLTEPITFNQDISPICFANSAKLPIASECTVSGWGMTTCTPDGEALGAWIERWTEHTANLLPVRSLHRKIISPSEVLRSVAVRKLTPEECNTEYFLEPGVGCVVSPPNTGAYMGDSGSPVLCTDQDGLKSVFGFYSNGLCASEGFMGRYPDYTRMYQFFADEISPAEFGKACATA